MTRLALLGLLGLALQGPGALGGMPPRVKFVLRNLCGRPIELYWIMPKGQNEINGQRQLVLQGPAVKNSSAMPIDSFVGHEFVVRPTDSPPPEKLAGGELLWEGKDVVLEAHFVMSETNDLVNLLPNMELERWDARHRAMRVISAAISHCQGAVTAAARLSRTTQPDAVAEDNYEKTSYPRPLRPRPRPSPAAF